MRFARKLNAVGSGKLVNANQYVPETFPYQVHDGNFDANSYVNTKSSDRRSPDLEVSQGGILFLAWGTHQREPKRLLTRETKGPQKKSPLMGEGRGGEGSPRRDARLDQPL